MKIDEKMVDHIAKLAMLKVAPADKAKYGEHLSKVLDHIDELSKVDTEGATPFANPMRERREGAKNTLREDVPGPSLPVADVLKNAPDAHLNQFRVEAVID